MKPGNESPEKKNSESPTGRDGALAPRLCHLEEWPGGKISAHRFVFAVGSEVVVDARSGALPQSDVRDEQGR